LLQVDSRIATHRIQFCDSEGPNTRARAKKTAYCELWYQVDGSPPAVPDDAPLRCNISRSGQQIIFDTAIKGKTVYYFARWVNSKGEHGPWSAMSSAIVI
jgi:hypothetical protein